MTNLEKLTGNNNFYYKLFGDNPQILHSKRSMLETVWKVFRKRFSRSMEGKEISIISVPNRVELLGKHTDYQGGETFLLTGPKNFLGRSFIG